MLLCAFLWIDGNTKRNRCDPDYKRSLKNGANIFSDNNNIWFSKTNQVDISYIEEDMIALVILYFAFKKKPKCENLTSTQISSYGCSPCMIKKEKQLSAKPAVGLIAL